MVYKFAAIAATAGLAYGRRSENSTDKRPNILFMMSDDHALKAISAYDKAHIHTPNIDRLAEEGMRFDNALVTNSLCGPARAVVITCKYSHINGFMQNDDGTVFDETQWTYPKEMQKGGYYTSIVGKYHLNSFPTHGGFDYWNILEGQGEYFQPSFYDNSDTKITEHEDSHVIQTVTDIVLDVLENKVDEEKPWMMMMHHKAPHRNQAAPLDMLGFFEDKIFDIPETFFDSFTTRTPASESAENKVKELYWTNDLKMDMPAGNYTDPGNGGGSYMKFDAYKSY